MKRVEAAGWLVLVLALMGVTIGPLRAGGAQISGQAAPDATKDTDANVTSGRDDGAPSDNADPNSQLPTAPELARALRAGVRERLGQTLVQVPTLRPGDAAAAQEPVPLPQEATLAQVLDALPEGVMLTPIVVHLPDPRQGRHARYFDQGIDALRRGASLHGHDQIGFLLPPPFKAGAPAANPAPDQYFVLFARETSFLVCLIVLESPVQGPKSGQLSTALSISKRMRSQSDHYRMLAPFFSGAASAVGMQLESFARARDLALEESEFDVVTGTATRSDIGQHLKRREDTWFRRTTPNDDEVIAFLSQALVERHGTWRQRLVGPLKLALLAEFDTAFGQAFSKDKKTATASEEAPGSPTVSECGKDQTATRAAGQPVLHTFRYPSAIAEVRQVRQRQEKRQEQSDDPLSLRRTLQLEVDLPAVDPDIPPLLSQITAFERELELGEQLTSICRERYDYLILAATDPLDLVYLAEESRKYCPGLPLVALGAEKIFRHPDVRSALDGLLVVGSYPLLNETPPWGTPSERPFSSHVTQGFYNAWLTLLNEALVQSEASRARRGEVASSAAEDIVPLLDYRALSVVETRDAGTQAVREGRPLWLTVLAGGTFWPLRTGCAVASDSVEERPANPAGTAHRAQHQGAEVAATPHARLGGTIRMAGVLLFAIAIAHVVWMRRPELVELRRDRLGARYRLGANLTLFLLILLMMPAMWAAPADPSAAPGLVCVYEVCRALACALLGYLAWAWLGDARHAIRELVPSDEAWRRGRRATSLSVLALLTFGASFVALSACWLTQHAQLTELERQMALTRMYNPVGISPLAPIAYLAAAYYAWSFVGLCRVRALIRFSELAPLPLRGEDLGMGPKMASGSTLTPALGDVLANLRGAWSGTYSRYEVLAACFAAVPGVYFCLRVRPTWEPAGYDWLLKLGLVVLYGLVVVVSVHFITLVTLLRRFLRQLAALPMVDSYDRVALKMKSSFGIQFGVRVPTFEELQLSGYSSTLLAVLMAAEKPGTSEQPGACDTEDAASAPTTTDAASAPTTTDAAGAPTTTDAASAPTTTDAARQDSHHPPSGSIAPNQGGEPLPAAYRQVFEQMLEAVAPRSAAVDRTLRAFRHADGRAIQIEERGHRALYETSQALFVALRKLWALRAQLPVTEELNASAPKLLAEGKLAELPTVALYAAAVPPRVLLWMRVAEDFVTLRIATFLSHVMTHLRYLLAFTLSASLLLILAVSSYPLEPTRLVTVFSWTLMLAVIALAFVVIVRMERNEVLSRLSGSTPGKVDFNFALARPLLVYVGLPLLAVLANIFPEIRDQLFAWVGPVKRLLP